MCSPYQDYSVASLSHSIGFAGIDYMFSSEAELRPALFEHGFNAVRPGQMWLL